MTSIETPFQTDEITATASTSLSAGQFINLFSDGTSIQMRPADCSLGYTADGFVLNNIPAGVEGIVWNLQTSINNRLSDLQPGITYYLSTNGSITTTAPTTSGYISQIVGKAISPTTIVFIQSDPIQLSQNPSVNQILSIVDGKLVGINSTTTSNGASSSGELVELDNEGYIHSSMLPPGSGVSSFNNRSGAVTLEDSDVIAALQFDPVNPIDLTNGSVDGVFNTLSAQSTFSQSSSAGANNESPLLQYGDMFTDAVVSGLVTTINSAVTGTLSPGVAYINGQRTVYSGGTYSVASSGGTSYLDLTPDGELIVSTNQAPTSGHLRTWEIISSGGDITSVTFMGKGLMKGNYNINSIASEPLHKAYKKGFLIPFYGYPSDGSTTTQVQQLIYTRSLFPDLEWFVIINPDSGPGTSVDPNFTQAIDIMRAYDITVLGYVDSSGSSVPLATLESNVATWMSFYTIDGIFIDNFPYTYTEARASYYQEAYAYVKQLLPWVVVNPGTASETQYFSGPRMWDILNIWESNTYPTSENDLYGDYASFYRNLGERFSGIVNSQPTFNASDTSVLSQSYSLEYVYSGVNYDNVSPYLTLEAMNMTNNGSMISTLTQKTTASTSTSGNVTISASQLLGGYFVDDSSQTQSYTITTDTAANIFAQFQNAQVGTTFVTRVFNGDTSNIGYPFTLVGGTGVTISTTNPSVPKGGWIDYLFTFTSIGTSPALTVTSIGSTAVPYNPEQIIATASTSLSAGQFVNLYVGTSTVEMQPADCSLGYPIDGFVLNDVEQGAISLVSRGDYQLNNKLSGLEPGYVYYLSTNGSITTTAPTTSGYISQVAGKAINDTTLLFSQSDYIKLSLIPSENQFLSIVDGNIVSINPSSTSTGPDSSGDIVALNDAGQIDSSMLPSTNAVIAAGAAILTSNIIIGTYTLTSAATIGSNFTGSTGSCLTASTSGSVFPVYHVPANTNTQTKIGTITFAPSAYVSTFSTQPSANLSFNTGDTLIILSPSVVDSTLATVSVSLLLSPDVQILSISGGASTLPANSIVMGYCCTLAGKIPTNFSGSVGNCLSASASGSVFSVYRVSANNTTQSLIGTINFATGSYSPTFSTELDASLSFSAGDTILVIAPSVVDSRLYNVSFSIVGVN